VQQTPTHTDHLLPTWHHASVSGCCSLFFYEYRLHPGRQHHQNHSWHSDRPSIWSNQCDHYGEIVKDITKLTLSITIAIATIVGALFAISAGVNYLVDKRLNDEATLNRIASKIRPSMIVDGTGRVLYDASGSVYISTENIKVEKYPIKVTKGMISEFNFKITITSKKYMQTAPFIECINGVYNITTERGKGNSWIFHAVDVAAFNAVWTEPERQENIFRIEIVPRL